ncbi:GntR family transcriptional regulator [Mycolicibacterium goodii]|uniref:FadR/GntR family transcriptional regulator n=1 Tax=Mycolicibacterium goodii TaxID=134601 RepID=UPI001056B909|nr:GntR family transcriptional regulator [Mycolicibacterium goodii]MBU8808322.1 GntR family transcriptional regulator [Mycolicibacterium goodii]
MTAAARSDVLRHVIFAPFDNGERAVAIADRMRTAILLDVFADGEQLPSEAELAAQFGVSPVTLREALSLLRAAGLVETRRGRSGGSFVRRTDYNPEVLGRQKLAEISTLDLRDLLDWRSSVAQACAAMAAERASDEEVEDLHVLVEAFETAPDAMTARLCEGRIHVCLAAASQSVRHTKATVQVLIDCGSMLSLVFASPILRERVAKSHRDLYDHVRLGDRVGAAASAAESANRIQQALAALARDLQKGKVS